MKKSVDIDNQLLNKVKKITNSKTAKAAIDNALQLVVTLHNQRQLIDLWGQVEINDET